MVAGPASLTLNLEPSSCLGLVITKGITVSASIEGASGRLLHQMTDIITMLTAAPHCTHVLCIPIAHPSPALGVNGALLLGFSSRPDLSSRRLTGLTGLCSLLSIALSRTAPEVICSVETMIGTHLGCEVCSSASDSDDSDEADVEKRRRCDDDDDDDSSKKRGPSPRQSLLVPIPEDDAENVREGEHGHGGEEEDEGQDEDSLRHRWDQKPKMPNDSPPPALPMHHPSPMPQHQHQYSMMYRFSKPAMAMASTTNAYHPLVLSYDDDVLEQEFSLWYAHRLRPLDSLFCILLVASMMLLTACQPSSAAGGGGCGGSHGHNQHTMPCVDSRTTTNARHSHPLSLSPVAAVPMLLPIALVLSASRYYWHARWREGVVAAVRLTLVVIAGLVSSLKAVDTAANTNTSVLACWVAAGGESLLTPALGLQLRTSRHIIVQCIAFMLMLVNIGTSCEDRGWACATAAAAAVLGVVLPTVVVRASERKSRQIFAAQIQLAAGVVE